jgi:urease accessory protein
MFPMVEGRTTDGSRSPTRCRHAPSSTGLGKSRGSSFGLVIWPPGPALLARSLNRRLREVPAGGAWTFLLLGLTSTAACAHSGDGLTGGFLGGFAHPIFGPDHVVAMVAVGLWGAVLGAPALWLLPIVFPLVMAFGGAFGILGVPVPGVETGIAVSAIVLGLMVALAARPPLWIAAVLVGAFAIFHGHAHGSELPRGVDAVAYSVGFVVATGLLHLSGIAFGLTARWPAGAVAVRAAGGVIALVGIAFLSGLA